MGEAGRGRGRGSHGTAAAAAVRLSAAPSPLQSPPPGVCPPFPAACLWRWNRAPPGLDARTPAGSVGCGQRVGREKRAGCSRGVQREPASARQQPAAAARAAPGRPRAFRKSATVPNRPGQAVLNMAKNSAAGRSVCVCVCMVCVCVGGGGGVARWCEKRSRPTASSCSQPAVAAAGHACPHPTLRRCHTPDRSFWMGVPVSSRRRRHGSPPMAWLILDWPFWEEAFTGGGRRGMAEGGVLQGECTFLPARLRAAPLFTTPHHTTPHAFRRCASSQITSSNFLE